MKETRHIPRNHPIRVPLTRMFYRARAYDSFREYYLVTKARSSSVAAWHESPYRRPCVLALLRRRRKYRAARARYLARQAQLLLSNRKS